VFPVVVRGRWVLGKAAGSVTFRAKLRQAHQASAYHYLRRGTTKHDD
jgi:hypothetical protein